MPYESNCTHPLRNRGPGLYCNCGELMEWTGCPCGCKQKTAGEYARERKLKDRYVSTWKCTKGNGTSPNGGLLATKYVEARSELEALRKVGWNRKMGWNYAHAHRIEITK